VLEGDAETERELDAVVWGVNVGSVIEGGSVSVGRNEEVVSGSVTATSIEPMSSCEMS